MQSIITGILIGGFFMIGMVITGHGEFAVGLAHALQMIAGEQKSLRIVPFKESEPIETLDHNITAAISELLDETDGVVVFSDLLGGSPFKSAMVAAAPHANVEVVCGTNLPMLIEIAMFREFAPDALSVVTQSITAGKEAVQHIVLNTTTQSDNIKDEDGI